MRWSPDGTGRAARIAALTLAAGALTGVAAQGAGAAPADQWSLVRIDAPRAWAELPAGRPATLVGVVDTGVDVRHPDLRPAMWRSPAGALAPDGQPLPVGSAGWDLVDGRPDPSPRPLTAGAPGPFFDHGTEVAGIIAARGGGGSGVTGVDPSARVLAVRVCTSAAAGCLETAAGMAWAADQGARVVNVSIGGAGRSAAEAQAIDGHPDTLFVVSAGNTGSDLDAPGGNHWPCMEPAPNLICVANLAPDGHLAPTSDFGPISVAIAAPGTDVLTDAPGGGVELGTGTSEAAPQVAGVASLLFSADPGATVAQVRTAILAGARRTPALAGLVATGGELSATGALARLRAIRSGDGLARVAGVPVPPAPRVTWARLAHPRDGRWVVRVSIATARQATRWRLVTAGGRIVASGRIRAGERRVALRLPIPTRVRLAGLRIVAAGPGGVATRRVVRAA